MNTPESFDHIAITAKLDAAEQIATKLVSLGFDHLLTSGVTLAGIQQRFAAHVLATFDGDGAKAAGALGVEPAALFELFAMPAVLPMPQTEALNAADEALVVAAIPQDTLQLILSPVLRAQPQPLSKTNSADALLADDTLLAEAIVAACTVMSHRKSNDAYPWHLLDPLMEVRYRQGIGSTGLLELPEFTGVKLNALKCRSSDCKLSQRFPEAAREVKRKANKNNLAARQPQSIPSTTPAPPLLVTAAVAPEVAPMQPAKASVQNTVATLAVHRSRRWSDEDKAELTRLYAENKGPQEIAKLETFAHRTPHAIESMASTLKITDPNRLSKPKADTKPVETTMATVTTVNEPTASIGPEAVHMIADIIAPTEKQTKTARILALRPLIHELLAKGETATAVCKHPEFSEFGHSLIYSHVAMAKATTADDKPILPRIASQQVAAQNQADLVLNVSLPSEPSNAQQNELSTSSKHSPFIASSSLAQHDAYYNSRKPRLADGIDIEAEKIRIAERKNVLLKAILVALPDCVTQALSIKDPAKIVANDAPVTALARQLKAQGFHLLSKDFETSGPAKQKYVSDFYWHDSGVLADVVRGPRLEPTLRLHAQLICPAGAQPLIKSLSPLPSGGRFIANCAQLGGERKVACISYDARSIEAGLKAINSLLSLEVLILKKFAVPPRGNDCGLVTFKGSTSRLRHLNLNVTAEPLRACCFPGTKATFVNPL